VTDPDTVNDYRYDLGVSVTPEVTPTSVLGRLAQAKAPTGDVAFSYDALGRVNARTFTDHQGGAYVEKTSRHADGTLAALEFYLPDTGFQQERVDYTYDSAARLRGIIFHEGASSQALYEATRIDPFGRVRQATYGDHVAYKATYADLGRRLLQEVTVSSALGARRILFLGYDPMGRELSRYESKDGAGSGPTTNVTHDRLGRLARAVQTDGATQLFHQDIRYNELGNILLLIHGTDLTNLHYGTDDLDRICRIDYHGGLGGTACNVVYDAVGNIVQQATRTGERALSYFASGQVRTITEQAKTAQIRYDAFGQVQALDLVGSGSTDTRHDRRYGGLIERRDQVVGTTTTSFISRLIPGPDGIVASRRGPGNAWVLHFGELRGNRFFTDLAGAFVQDVDYQPYGEATSTGVQPGSAQYTPSQWNGGDALSVFGLSHLGVRLYDPVIGRFLSRDLVLVPRTAATTNPYAFAMNDPVNNADPSGLDWGLGICGTSHGGPCTDPPADNASPYAGLIAVGGWLGSQIFGAASGGAHPQAASRPLPPISFTTTWNPFANADVAALRAWQAGADAQLDWEQFKRESKAEELSRLDCFTSLSMFGECAGNGGRASARTAYGFTSLFQQMLLGMADDSSGRTQPGYVHPFDNPETWQTDEDYDNLEIDNLGVKGGVPGIPSTSRRTWSKAERLEQAARQGGKCEYCGRPIDIQKSGTPTSLHGDHYVPYRLTGKTEPFDHVAACLTCNLSKGGKTVGPGPNEWWPPGWGPRPLIK
jgi:RHS repeat-associated protein